MTGGFEDLSGQECNSSLLAPSLSAFSEKNPQTLPCQSYASVYADSAMENMLHPEIKPA